MKLIYKIGLLFISIFMSFLPLSVKGVTLYGVGLNGQYSSQPDSSSLYYIDPVSGESTLIGDLGYAVNAIAVDPTTGLIYGATAPWNKGFNGLLLIDPVTGSATEIGEFGISFDNILGLTFNSAGQLFAWQPGRRSYLVTIDLTKGKATTLMTYYFRTALPIIAFDNSDNLILINGVTVYEINQLDWVAHVAGSLFFYPGSGDGDFDPATGLLWVPLYNADPSISSIRVINLLGEINFDIDTNIQFLQAVVFDDFDSDSDVDGISDSDDFCPETPPGVSVDFQGCSSQQLLDEYCGCDQNWKNHGEYVNCVVHLAEEQLSEGLITLEEKNAIVSHRARNKCGKNK